MKPYSLKEILHFADACFGVSFCAKGIFYGLLKYSNEMDSLKIVFVLMLAVLSSTAVFAQKNSDPNAKIILDAMSANYKKMNAYGADFTYSMLNSKDKALEKMQGSIKVQDNKYALKMDGQHIFNNGKKVWTFIKEDNEVTVTDYDPEEGDISPAEVYQMYQKGFRYHLIEEKGGLQVIDLTPDDRNKEYFKIRLTINKTDKRLQSWKIFEKSGRRYLYAIRNFQANISVKTSDFQFDKSKYPDVEIVEL